MVERAPVTEAKVYTPNSFVRKLYSSTLLWLKEEKQAEVLRTYREEDVDSWESYSDYPPRDVTLGARIKKAVLLQNPQNVYALVLSSRVRNRHQWGRTLGVEFGYFPIRPTTAERFNADTPVEELRMLVHQSFMTHGSGEFYVHDRLNKVYIDCWADGWTYGGKNINGWPEKKLQSPQGIEACMEVVKRLERNAFVGLK